jgi:hypothetical protein
MSVPRRDEILLAQVRHGPAVFPQDPDGNQLDHRGDVMAGSPFLSRLDLGARASQREAGGRDTQYPQRTDRSSVSQSSTHQYFTSVSTLKNLYWS